MKTYYNKKQLLWYLGFAALLTGLASCTSMDANYQKFIKRGIPTYPGKADSVMVYPGKNRIKLSWLVFDNSVTHAKIYWRNKTDSMKVPIKNAPGTDTVSVILKNMKEGSYTFIIRDFNDEGHTSIPISIVGHVYGQTYARSIKNRNRLLLSMKQLGATKTINWGNPGKGMVGTILKYMNQSGVADSIFVSADSSQTNINNFSNNADINNLSNKDSTFTYYSLFIPDSTAIDTFFTKTKKIDYLSILTYEDFDRSNWKIYGYDSQASVYLAASLAIDGNKSTAWDTQWRYPPDPLPHYISIDMGESHHVHGLKIVVPSAKSFQQPKTITVQFSSDGKTWRDGQDFTLPFPKVQKAKVFLSHPVKARYFKIIIHTNVGPTNVITNISEIYAF